MRTLRASLAAAALAAPLLLAVPAGAAGPTVEQCLECHGDSTIEMSLPGGKTLSLYVDLREYRQSVHGKAPCTACHEGAAAPHGKLAPATCGRCHADAEKTYGQSSHGLLHAKGNKDVAGCGDCHGKHDIRRTADPKSKAFHLSIDKACLACHTDRAVGERYGLPGPKVIEAYEQSVHGMALHKSGLMGSATCPDCHGNHRILPGDQPRSGTHRQNIPTLCGKCHPGILEQYEKSIHGKGMRAGIAESPVCTDCHGEHTITKHDDPAGKVSAKNIPKTCAACHENLAIASRYALPKKRLTSYMDSFHGVALEYGMTKVANCASCHGFHDVLPSSDPASAVHRENLPKTCGKCHPNAGPNFAKGIVHVEVTPEKALGVYAVRIFYTVFIAILIALFVLHVGLELYGRRRRAAGREGGGPK